MLADQVGLDFFGVGEHHRDDFAVSAPEVVLAAIAGADRADPPRLRGHRAQLRRSGPRVRALRHPRRGLRTAAPRSSSGAARSPSRSRCSASTSRSTRSCSRRSSTCSPHLLERAAGHLVGHRRAPPLTDQEVYPHDRVRPLTTWVGVGGSPESVVRAARYGLPLMLAIIGGDPDAVRAVRRPLPPRARAARAARRCRSACTRPATSPTTDEQAREELWPHYKAMRDRIGRERGWAPDARRTSSRPRPTHGALYVGSPETVAREDRPHRAARSASQRFDLKYSDGHAAARDDDAQRSSCTARRSCPRVRELLAEAPAPIEL